MAKIPNPRFQKLASKSTFASKFIHNLKTVIEQEKSLKATEIDTYCGP